MATSSLQFPVVRLPFSSMVHAGFLQLFMVVMAIADRCTRAVPRLQEYPAKKVHVLRRVPATCSNWDKAWSWLTKVDCGTKYRLDLVTVPSREVRQYKLQYVCCDGNTDCKEADNVQSPGFDTTDEKFLAIVLGSAAACVVIIIIIFAVTFYTKKSNRKCSGCHFRCDQESHVYSSPDGDECHDPNEEKQPPEDVVGEKEYKAFDADYAEICDSRLPRYTDIFKDAIEGREDPFNKASAPPLYSAVPPTEYINAERDASPSVNPAKETEIVGKTSPIPETLANDVLTGRESSPRTSSTQQDETATSEDADGILYYNVQEKRKQKRRVSGSQDKNLSASKGDLNVPRSRNPSDSSLKSLSKGSRSSLHSSSSKSTLQSSASKSTLQSSASRSILQSSTSKTTLQAHPDKMARSSSASETLDKHWQASSATTQQKRRSAPPGSMDGVLENVAANPTNTRPSSTSPDGRRVTNTYEIIRETTSAPPDETDHPDQIRGQARPSSKSLHRSPVRKTSHHRETSPLGPCSKTSGDENGSPGPASPVRSKQPLLTRYARTSLECDLLDSESSHQAGEQDSLLRSSSCHSGCGQDTAFEDCEHCSNYDILRDPCDSDTASLHIYQCLDEVRRECQVLRETEAAAYDAAAQSKKKRCLHSSKV